MSDGQPQAVGSDRVNARHEIHYVALLRQGVLNVKHQSETKFGHSDDVSDNQQGIVNMTMSKRLQR